MHSSNSVTRAAEHEGLDVLARLDQTYFMLGLGAGARPETSALAPRKKCALSPVAQRVGAACLLEALQAQDAGVAAAAGEALGGRRVAGVGERVIDA